MLRFIFCLSTLVAVAGLSELTIFTPGGHIKQSEVLLIPKKYLNGSCSELLMKSRLEINLLDNISSRRGDNWLLYFLDFQDVSTTKRSIISERAVGIEVDGVKKCLGAFVTAKAKSKSRFIATSAHCVYGVQASRLKLITWEDSTSIETIQVKRVMVHPYYVPPSPDYDIALLKTNEKDKQTALLINKSPVSSTIELEAIYWDLNKNPESITARSEDRKSCRAKLASHIVVTTRMLCANTEPIPLMNGSLLVNNTKAPPTTKLVGVGSYYVRGDSEKYPKIFTNIANPEIKSFLEIYLD